MCFIFNMKFVPELMFALIMSAVSKQRALILIHFTAFIQNTAYVIWSMCMMYWYQTEGNPHLEKTEQQLFLRNTFSALTLITEYTDSVADDIW